MALHTNQTGKLKEVKEKPKLEKDIENVFEVDLFAIMGLELVKSEFAIKNKRIDTLAYDSQINAFIIIEYKRDKNISVVFQCFTLVTNKYPEMVPRYSLTSFMINYQTSGRRVCGF